MGLPRKNWMFAEDHDQLRLRRFEQNGRIFDRRSGKALISRVAKNLSQKRADVKRGVDAEQAGPGISGFAAGIA